MLVDGKTIITSGVWKEGEEQPFVDAGGMVTREISKSQLKTVSLVTVMPEAEYVTRIAGTIEKDKHLYFQKGNKFQAYYIGDAEEKYILEEKSIAQERFYNI